MDEINSPNSKCKCFSFGQQSFYLSKLPESSSMDISTIFFLQYAIIMDLFLQFSLVAHCENVIGIQKLVFFGQRLKMGEKCNMESYNQKNFGQGNPPQTIRPYVIRFLNILRQTDWVEVPQPKKNIWIVQDGFEPFLDPHCAQTRRYIEIVIRYDFRFINSTFQPTHCVHPTNIHSNLMFFNIQWRKYMDGGNQNGQYITAHLSQELFDLFGFYSINTMGKTPNTPAKWQKHKRKH